MGVGPWHCQVEPWARVEISEGFLCSRGLFWKLLWEQRDSRCLLHLGYEFGEDGQGICGFGVPHLPWWGPYQCHSHSPQLS